MKILIAYGNQTGLTLSVQFKDESGTNLSTAVTTGFTEFGNGNYQWLGTPPGGASTAIVSGGSRPTAPVDLDPVSLPSPAPEGYGGSGEAEDAPDITVEMNEIQG